MNQKKNKKIFKITSFTILTFIIIGFLLKGNFSGAEFNSEKWKNFNGNKEDEWSLRWNMMNSLRNNYELEGMTKEKVLELLGKPDSHSQNKFNYYLGYAKWGIDVGNLTIFFNENGIVKSYLVLRS
jgi:hypothetical protein